MKRSRGYARNSPNVLQPVQCNTWTGFAGPATVQARMTIHANWLARDIRVSAQVHLAGAGARGRQDRRWTAVLFTSKLHICAVEGFASRLNWMFDASKEIP